MPTATEYILVHCFFHFIIIFVSSNHVIFISPHDVAICHWSLSRLHCKCPKSTLCLPSCCRTINLMKDGKKKGKKKFSLKLLSGRVCAFYIMMTNAVTNHILIAPHVWTKWKLLEQNNCECMRECATSVLYARRFAFEPGKSSKSPSTALYLKHGS